MHNLHWNIKYAQTPQNSPVVYIQRIMEACTHWNCSPIFLSITKSRMRLHKRHLKYFALELAAFRQNIWESCIKSCTKSHTKYCTRLYDWKKNWDCISTFVKSLKNKNVRCINKGLHLSSQTLHIPSTLWATIVRDKSKWTRKSSLNLFTFQRNSSSKKIVPLKNIR